MCGIAGVISLDKKSKSFNKESKITAMTLFLELQDRGQHAWGYYLEKSTNNSHLNCGKKDDSLPGEIWKMKGPIQSFFSVSGNKIYLNDTVKFLMHTRAATEGSAEKNDNNHPFCTKNFILAHNGCISNSTELKTKHDITTTIECDSYIIVALIQKFYEESNSVVSSIKKTISEITGSFACWLYHKDVGDLYLFRNSNPTSYYIDTENQLFVFASESDNICKAYGDKKLKDNTSITDAYRILKLSDNDLLEMDKFEYTTTYRNQNNCSNQNFYRNQPILPKQIADISDSLLDLYRIFEPYEKECNLIQYVIAIIEDNVRILVRPEELEKKLDEAGFKPFKKNERDYAGAFVHYLITPLSTIPRLVKNLIGEHDEDSDVPALPSPTEPTQDKEFIDAIRDIADTLSCSIKIEGNKFTFSYPEELEIPKFASNLFKKVGFQFNKYNMVLVKNNSYHQSQLVNLLKELNLYGGD